MGVDVLDLIVYEGTHLGLNGVTCAVLTWCFRYLADIIHWFPKQDIHYFVLIILFVYSISYDKRRYGFEPPFVTQAVRLVMNLVLVFGSNYVVGMVCNSKLPTSGDPEEATAGLTCMGGMVGSIVVYFLFRLFTIAFLRCAMIGIQVVLNIFYQFDLL